jgi:hypothetical protein
MSNVPHSQSEARRAAGVQSVWQLDVVLKGTQQVVDGFQDLVDCTHCKMTCTDLIYTMAILQQMVTFVGSTTNFKAGGAIEMGFGRNEVPINDAGSIAVLVLFPSTKPWQYRTRSVPRADDRCPHFARRHLWRKLTLATSTRLRLISGLWSAR